MSVAFFPFDIKFQFDGLEHTGQVIAIRKNPSMIEARLFYPALPISAVQIVAGEMETGPIMITIQDQPGASVEVYKAVNKRLEELDIDLHIALPED